MGKPERENVPEREPLSGAWRCGGELLRCHPKALRASSPSATCLVGSLRARETVADAAQSGEAVKHPPPGERVILLAEASSTCELTSEARH